MHSNKLFSFLISDRLFLFTYLVLLLLIPVNFLYEIRSIFQPSVSTNNYGIITAFFILVFVVIWIIANNMELINKFQKMTSLKMVNK